MDPSDDPQVMSLARAAQGGDSEAFSALITALHLPVRRFLAARAISADQVEELLQDTFVAAWQGLPQWRGEGSPRSWVVGIAANLLRADVRRRMKTQGVGPDLMDALLLKAAETHDEAESDEVERMERFAKALPGCLALLDQRSRDLLDLRYRQGISLADLARQFQRPEGTLAMILLRLRQSLRRCLMRPA